MAKRSKNLDIHSKDTFETERQNYSDTIIYNEAQYGCIRYTRLDVWCLDGINLNTENGKDKYIASVRTAIFDAVGWLRKKGINC